MKKRLSLFLAIFATVTVLAVEGMFPLNELKNLDETRLKAMGLEIPLELIRTDISRAVVHLGGGSGSFVSDKGLIVTNHHVAYRAVQYNASAEHNYIDDGFYATTLENELPAPGYYADIIQEVTDVTDRVKAVIKPDMTDAARYEAIQDVVKAIETEVESESPNIRANVAAMYQGTQYLLFKSVRLLDIRLVYAPPASIGEFGGDIDNFEWPRHTGDFSFMRAYVSPDGKPAAYAKDNVPYQSRHFLNVSTRQLKKDDFNFVVGFPGSTNRYMTSEQIDFYLNEEIPFRVKLFKEIIEILEEVGGKSAENKVRVASWVKMLNNSMKYYQGVQNGLHRDNVVKRFAERDAKLQQWIVNNKKEKQFGTTIEEINKQNDLTKPISATTTVMGYTRLIPTFSAAGTLTRWAEEKVKPDMERDPAYMDRNIERTARRLKSMQNDLLVESDIRLLTYFLKAMAELPEDRRPATFQKLFGEIPTDGMNAAIEQAVKDMYANTGLTDLETRMSYMDMSAAELAELNDPLLKVGGAFAKELQEARKKTEAIAGALNRLKPDFIQLIHQATNNQLYPDANSTIRMTYGTIQGYSPEEALWCSPFTTLAGAIAKETGEEPFANPKKLIELYKQGDFGSYGDPSLDGNVPLNFLSDVDTTGGNSGSPTLNGKGELIGLLFDGNFESISADYYYNVDVTRSIIVDSRYMIYILDKFSDAQSLLDELTIVN